MGTRLPESGQLVVRVRHLVKEFEPMVRKTQGERELVANEGQLELLHARLERFWRKAHPNMRQGTEVSERDRGRHTQFLPGDCRIESAYDLELDWVRRDPPHPIRPVGFVSFPE